MAEINLLVINPGSTSTKISIYENGREIHRKNLLHSAESLEGFKRATDQALFRQAEVEKFIDELNYDTSRLTAIACRGGSLPPIHTGGYEVNDEMVEVLCNRPIGQHASSTAALIGYDIAKRLRIKAYIYDGNTADEMEDLPRVSGCPLVKKLSMGHILNTKAVARMYAESIHKKYEDLNLILIHTGGGISIGLHKKGIIADILTDEDGTMAPERSGGLPSIGMARLCFSGKYSFDEISAMVRGKGGITAYLGTNDTREVERRIGAGDSQAKLIYEAMIYQTAKGVGALATAVCGQLDGIIVTGGIANSQMFMDKLRKRIAFLHPVTVIPGEYEMEALAAGITRILNGEETARIYREHEEVAEDE